MRRILAKQLKKRAESRYRRRWKTATRTEHGCTGSPCYTQVIASDPKMSAKWLVYSEGETQLNDTERPVHEVSMNIHNIARRLRRPGTLHYKTVVDTAHTLICDSPGVVQCTTCPAVHTLQKEIFMIQSENCFKEKDQYFPLVFRDTGTYTTSCDGDSSNKHNV